MRRFQFFVAVFSLYNCFLLTSIYGKALSEYQIHSCSEDQVLLDPIHELSDSDLYSLQDVFDPEKTNRLLISSGYLYSREDSSAYLDHLLETGINRIHQKEVQIIMSKGSVRPIEQNHTYSEVEYKKRLKGIAQIKKENFDPLINDLYRSHLEVINTSGMFTKPTVSDRETKLVSEGFWKKISEQRDLIVKRIEQTKPEILKKIGSLMFVSETEKLPFDYRDGYVTKMWFLSSESSKPVGLSPKVLVNELSGYELSYLNSLERWKQHCFERWQLAIDLENSSFYSPSYLWFYLKTWWTGEEKPKKIIEKKKLMKKVYESAVHAYERAQESHKLLARLTDEEIGFLLELFYNLRFGDIPKCEEQVHSLNAKLAQMMQYRHSTADSQLSTQNRLRAELFARDVEFYQELYETYSLYAAYKLTSQN